MIFKRYDSKSAYRIVIGNHGFFFSYDTLVAYKGPYGQFETDRNYSRTTNRHLQLFRNDCYGSFRSIPQKDLEDLSERALAQYGLSRLYERMGLASGHASKTVADAFGEPVWATTAT